MIESRNDVRAAEPSLIGIQDLDNPPIVVFMDFLLVVPGPKQKTSLSVIT